MSHANSCLTFNPLERMRELKFRVWFDGINAMGMATTLEGSNRNGYKGDMWDEVQAECFINGRQQFYNGYNFKLMQYIGLKDKNEKEIYEGDIIEMFWPWQGAAKNTKVVYVDTIARWAMEEIRPDGNGLYHYFDHDNSINIEVIGNIYETPELLKL